MKMIVTTVQFVEIEAGQAWNLPERVDSRVRQTVEEIATHSLWTVDEINEDDVGAIQLRLELERFTRMVIEVYLNYHGEICVRMVRFGEDKDERMPIVIVRYKGDTETFVRDISHCLRNHIQREKHRLDYDLRLLALLSPGAAE